MLGIRARVNCSTTTTTTTATKNIEGSRKNLHIRKAYQTMLNQVVPIIKAGQTYTYTAIGAQEIYWKKEVKFMPQSLCFLCVSAAILKCQEDDRRK